MVIERECTQKLQSIIFCEILLANLIDDWIYLKMGAYVRSWYDEFLWSLEYLLWISRHLFYEEFKWLLINIFTKTTNIIRPLPDTMYTILSPIKRSEKFLHDIFVYRVD